ncbi:acyl-CoA dehydrogenase C-terminal domain-containing protein [Aliiglaciecola sp. CAU 1673]|uniref:acyl-CoA dehydrogenase C-terminal domain-containing protein n=1 Tax=Aliiglaciecola sp. CAU 1673 TaxID=3032595 RepID=UPI0023DA7611|nr:acyl-CoA dehydrogenase C-terminal domain-containing protein [Aliiglaciecola sp. CAU 1673]MDF2179225.1 acyl-CoA dehydrogenase C-terminal domain-containing protein [Aliiglaciecola sp. CAU 1673]
MADYRAPLKDIQFVLNDVFDAPALWQSCEALAQVIDADTAQAILEEAAKLVEKEVAPRARNADEQGVSWDAGKVTTPDGYKESFQAIANGGWIGLSGDPELGGMGMPKMLSAQYEELLCAGDVSFSLYPGLTYGATMAILAHGSDELKQTYLPKMYSGEWAGSMCLTEPHAGTDLGIIRTKAVDNGDGSYSISGTKMFITGGEQDLTDNIIHLVLAKLPDAPAGSKGISMFLVPKIEVLENGELGGPNGVSCGSVEHKMGIHGSATCVMNFDNAKGYLVGDINKGLAAMFVMMNYERLGVGIQGLGCSERSYQNALAYAKERLQSRAATGPVNPDKAADPILVHADVRRMLLNMKALTEGGRAFSTYVAKQLDLAKYADDAEVRQQADKMVALLTPVAKAFLTDMGLDITVLGQQIFGGHGYIREWGQEQLVRDVRIAQIYEGTNGIQALDLMGRKVAANGGEYIKLFTDEIQAFTDAQSDDAMQEFIQPLTKALGTLNEVTQWVLAQSAKDANEIGAASVDYLHLLGYVSYAYMWALMAKAALEAKTDDQDFYQAKLATARYYFGRLLPRIYSLQAGIQSGSALLYGHSDEQF